MPTSRLASNLPAASTPGHRDLLPLPTKDHPISTAPRWDRRAVLASLSATAAWPFARVVLGDAPDRRIRFEKNPFSLGIASGDPAPDGVVLWTRLAPDPVHGGGMPPEDVAGSWVVAEDEGLTRVVRKGTATASTEWAYSVHVEVEGLRPDRTYWYRFTAGDAESPVGRTRTAPAAEAMLDRFWFAFASCQHYETGYFTALGHIAEEDVHAVVQERSRATRATWRAPLSIPPVVVLNV